MTEAPSKTEYLSLKAAYVELSRSYDLVDSLHDHLCDVADSQAAEIDKLKNKLNACVTLLTAED